MMAQCAASGKRDSCPGSGVDRIRVIVEVRTPPSPSRKAHMRLTYDPEVGAAYMMLVDAIAPGQARHQVEVPHNDSASGQYILDFAEDGKLLGLEIVFASDALPASVLAAAEPPL
jgi:uncharacterized protein YuzE